MGWTAVPRQACQTGMPGVDDAENSSLESSPKLASIGTTANNTFPAHSEGEDAHMAIMSQNLKSI